MGVADGMVGHVAVVGTTAVNCRRLPSFEELLGGRLGCTSFFEADAGPQADAPIGCHGLSPASAQACTSDQLRAALGQ